MTNLFAICKPPAGPIVIKRVEIAQAVQNIIDELFQQQAIDFLEGVHESVQFGGDYKPDTDEVLVLDAPNEIDAMHAAVANPLGFEVVAAANFANESIKGLFASPEGGGGRIFIQSFSAQQFLARGRVALIFDGNVFRRVTEPSFALDSKLVAITENQALIFKSFHLLKRIFILEDVYREATDQQIETFCGHASLLVEDLAAVQNGASQPIRRLFHAVHTANVLDQSPVADIQATAQELGLELLVEDGRIVVPTERRQLKDFLRLLDESIYAGPLSARPLVASGKRPYARG